MLLLRFRAQKDCRGTGKDCPALLLRTLSATRQKQEEIQRYVICNSASITARHCPICTHTNNHRANDDCIFSITCFRYKKIFSSAIHVQLLPSLYSKHFLRCAS